MTIRLVRAHFDPGLYGEIDKMMKKSAVSLVPAMQAQPGLIDYYVAVDRRTGSMIHVSVWETERDADAMTALTPLQKTKAQFEASGLTLDEITNHEVVWSV